jgi:hypothetical protein
MEMLIFRISGLLLNWMVLYPVDKKDFMLDFIDKIKSAANMTLWLTYVNQSIT